MKKILIICGIAILTFTSCESESSNSDLPESETNIEQSPESANLVESTTLLDGEEIAIYTDVNKGDIFAVKDGELADIKQLSDEGQLIFYFNAELRDYLIFTSKDKMKSIIENSDQYSELVDKIRTLDPSMIKPVSTKGASANAGSPSVTIATAHSLGGYTFTKALPFPSRYGNPHLRCNQYETDCINFNDQISSIKISQGVYAEFYTGSFPSPGHHLYLDGGMGAVQINNLSSSGWNDKITSFWASTASTYETNLNIIFPGNISCGHNYNDPACP